MTSDSSLWHHRVELYQQCIGGARYTCIMPAAHHSTGLNATLVGRTAQLEFLRERLTQVLDGRGQIALVGGDAGIGKSRLVAELNAFARQHGAILLEGRCFEEDQAFPFAPILDLLRTFSVGRSADELLRAFGPTAAELVALSPQLTAVLPGVVSAPSLAPEQAKRRLFEALTVFLQRLSAERGAAPLVLVFEDLHWCDSMSLQWLLSFARQLEPHPVLLVLTVRRDETNYDVDRTLAALGRLPVFSELELHPCTRADVDQMLRSIFHLSDPPHPDFLGALYELTGGNPFFVEEVLKSLIAAGDIYAEAGAWTRKPMRELRIPRSIQVAVQQRVRELGQAAHRLLMLAAVAGQRFPFVVLQAATQSPEHELVAHIKELLAVHLVVEQGDDRFAFRHELTRRAVYATLLAHERKLLHQSMAEAIKHCYGATIDAHAGELARHYFQAGLPALAMPWARRAGDQAKRLYAHSEALRHYASARECATALGQHEEVAAINRAIGAVYSARGQFLQAISFLEPALQLTTDLRGRTALKVEIGKAYADIADRRGRALLQAALSELDPRSDTHDIAVATLWLGRYCHYLGQYTAAQHYLEQARTLSEPLGDAVTLRFVYSFLAATYLMSAQFDQSTTWARRCIALGEAQNYLPAVVHGYLYLAENAEFEARWGDVYELAERGGYYAQQSAADSQDMWLALERASAAYYSGELNAGLALARECVETATELEERRGIVHATKVLVLLAAAIGSEQQAADAAQAALRIADQTMDLLMRCYSRLALAALCMQREDWAAAAELYTACEGMVAGTENRTLMMELSAPLAEAEAELGRLADAERRIAACLCLAQQTGARHFQAIAWRVQGKVQTLLGRSDEAAAALERAVGLCEALGSRLELARALVARGAFNRQRNDLAAAYADWSRACALCIQMGARPLLWRSYAVLAELALRRGQAIAAQQALDAARVVVDDLAATIADNAVRERLQQRAAELLPRADQRRLQTELGGLTLREREVATLIAQGYTNRAIAQALVLSERTVTTHVSNILSKLGFTSRAQIATWAGTTGLGTSTQA